MSVIPFISESFKKDYIIPYYIGEALLALIPAVIAMGQGAGDDLGCRSIIKFSNFTNNNSEVIYLNETIHESIPLRPIFSEFTYYMIIFVFILMSTTAFLLLNCLKSVKKQHKDKNASENKFIDRQAEFENSKLLEINVNIEVNAENKHKNEKFLLYSINFLNTFFSYGILAGLQSYSTLPYGLSLTKFT